MSVSAEASRRDIWRRRIEERREALEAPLPFIIEGRLRRMVGLTIEAVGCQAAVGDRCLVVAPGGARVEAEVVGFSGDRTYLMPSGDLRGLVPNSRVIPTGEVYDALVGEHLLGRVIDGTGKPLDGKGPLRRGVRYPLVSRPVNPLHRQPITEPLDVGIRTINALLTIGRGQRLGLFAGSGVGKSVLLGMMTRHTAADITVVGLIGERGREVKYFIDNILGREGMARAVVVATPADTAPMIRLHGAMLATSVAEYFRDRGHNVLLLMDSLTRFAQAQREIALAIGEPPATRGYPPSVFAKIPQLVERAGNGERGGGSITAIYTVLTEGDDQQDPVAVAARAILDGHFVLSRALAEAGHYPAIDVEASISRAMTEITNAAHQRGVGRFRQLLSTYQANSDLISVGAYKKGSDPAIDQAIEYRPRLMQFLRQGINERVRFADSLAQLHALIDSPVAVAGAPASP